MDFLTDRKHFAERPIAAFRVDLNLAAAQCVSVYNLAVLQWQVEKAERLDVGSGSHLDSVVVRMCRCLMRGTRSLFRLDFECKILVGWSN